MQESKVKEKLRKDTDKFVNNTELLPKILKSWEGIHPVYFVEIVLNIDSPLSSKILINAGIKVHKNIYKKDIYSNTSINNYFDYLESININRMSLDILNESREIIEFSIKSEETEDVLKKRASRLNFLINDRLSKVKNYDITKISIGDHEHDNVKDFSFYCSSGKDMGELFKNGQDKIDRSFLEFTRNENEKNQDISYFIEKLSEFDLAEVSHIEDDGSLINLAYIYLEIANLGGPVDYCHINGVNTISLWRYED
jgi:hypothetical protein